MRNGWNLVRGTSLAVLVIAILTAAPASAQNGRQMTAVTFNSTVRLPGGTLPPGTYKFEVADMSSSGGRMMILDAHNRFVTSAAVTLVQRSEAGSATVSFREPSSTPPQVLTLFGAGTTVGFEFAYPHQDQGAAAVSDAGHLAKAAPARVPAPPAHR